VLPRQRPFVRAARLANVCGHLTIRVSSVILWHNAIRVCWCCELHDMYRTDIRRCTCFAYHAERHSSDLRRFSSCGTFCKELDTSPAPLRAVLCSMTRPYDRPSSTGRCDPVEGHSMSRTADTVHVAGTIPLCVAGAIVPDKSVASSGQYMACGSCTAFSASCQWRKGPDSNRRSFYALSFSKRVPAAKPGRPFQKCPTPPKFWRKPEYSKPSPKGPSAFKAAPSPRRFSFQILDDHISVTLLGRAEAAKCLPSQRLDPLLES